ncbi:protein WALLS ARE THIN 1-like [Phragmites australis]|uniref:protein WALLS ARE THIN 1-like n=1 Tax=Phragmites australis TaxID=29695 RepID=UPI002D796D80|nr:protein WALLS ARE THIN 1-like [Phragmites australis]
MGRDQAAAAVMPEKLKLFMGVLALQFLLAGFHIVTRAALNMGISKIVFIVYRNIISLALLTPFAYFLEKKDRPPLTFSLLVEFFLQFLAIAAFTEEDLSSWKVRSGGELFTILYAGLVASGVAFALQIWCIDRGGPLFTAVFQPVQTVAVAVMAAIILGDQLYTGGIIGAVLIVIGLYFVLWGKSAERKARNQDLPQGGGDVTRHLLGGDASAKDEEAPTDLA